MANSYAQTQSLSRGAQVCLGGSAAAVNAAMATSFHREAGFWYDQREFSPGVGGKRRWCQLLSGRSE